MDFRRKRKGLGSARRFVLERKQRISIEDRGSLLIKDTQTQVRELYRRDITNKAERTSSSVADTKILKTSRQVDALNKKIENEIDKLKNFRDFLLEADNKNFSNRKENLPTPTNKCAVRIPDLNENISEKVVEEMSSASDREEKQGSIESSLNTDTVESVFHTMNLTAPLVPNTRDEPTGQQTTVLRKSNGTTFNHEDNAKRISGGCIFQCATGTPVPYTTYQSDYVPISHCCQNYSGLCQCHVNPCCPSYTTMPMHVPYPANSCQYDYPIVPSCCQSQPIAYGMPCCTCAQPNCCRQSTDLRTNYFCRQWCAPRVAQCSPNDSFSFHSTSSSPRRSSKLCKSRGRNPSVNQRANKMEVGKTEDAKLEKLKAAKLKSTKLKSSKLKCAEVADARQKADQLEAVMETAKLEAAAMCDQMRPIANQHADEQVIINGYVPARAPASKPRNQDIQERMRMHREYMQMYQKEHDKSAEKESSRTISQLDVTPTYITFPNKSKQKEQTAHQTGPSYSFISKGDNKRDQGNSSRRIEIIDRIQNMTETVNCDGVGSSPSQLPSYQPDSWYQNATPYGYTMQFDVAIPNRSEIPDQPLSGFLSGDSYQNFSPQNYSIDNVQWTPDRPWILEQNDSSYKYAINRQCASADNPGIIQYPVQAMPDIQRTPDHIHYGIQSPVRLQRDEASSNISRMPNQKGSEVQSPVRLQHADATPGQKSKKKMPPKELQAKHPQTAADEPLAPKEKEIRQPMSLGAPANFNNVECFCNGENINRKAYLRQRFPESSPRTVPKSSLRSYTESSAENNPFSSPQSNDYISSISHLDTSPDNNLQCSSRSPSGGNSPLRIERTNQIDSENTEYATCHEAAQVGKGHQTNFGVLAQEEYNCTMSLDRAVNSSMQDISGYSTYDNASSSRNKLSVQRGVCGNFETLSEKFQFKMPKKSTPCEKRTRLVTFQDEDIVGLKSNMVKSYRSVIDWERAYQLRIKEAELSLESDLTDDDISDSCRSNSVADTEFTCIESNNEDNYLTCTESQSEPECNYLPRFTGCPCMYQNYLRLAAMCE